jgi:hypothetical protein
MSRNEKVEESDAETHGHFRNEYVALCQIIYLLRNNKNRKNFRMNQYSSSKAAYI